MNRVAFLIGGTYAEELPGVGMDIGAWKNYLTSSKGGSWEKNEIYDYTGWSKQKLIEGVQVGMCFDYALVCFSGHGEPAIDEYGFPYVNVFINDREKISERELNPLSPRAMIIMDCCRVHPESEMFSFSLNESTEEDTSDDFKLALQQCEKGLIKVYAADDGEAADDEVSFSRVLMGIGAHHRGPNVLDIRQATERTNGLLAPQQHPQCIGGRRRRYFPFAMSGKKVGVPYV